MTATQLRRMWRRAVPAEALREAARNDGIALHALRLLVERGVIEAAS